MTPGAGATIVVYHSVGDIWTGNWTDPRFWTPHSNFENHLNFFKSHRTVVRLADLAATLADGRPVEPGTVVLTFDDAYLDHFEIAVPLLEKYGLSGTFFVPTDWVGRWANWSDELYSAIRHRREHRLDLGEGGRFNLWWPGDARRAYDVAYQRLFNIHDSDERDRAVSMIRDQLEMYGYPPRRLMNWDELRKLAASPAVDIGVHGARHLSMPTLTPDQQRAEIQDALDQLRSELDLSPRLFAYPYAQFNEETDAIVSTFGFDAVLVGRTDYRVLTGANPMHLGRCEAHSDLGRMARWTG